MKVGQVKISSMDDQEIDKREMALLSSKIKRGESLVVLCIDISPIIKKEDGYFLAFLLSC